MLTKETYLKMLKLEADMANIDNKALERYPQRLESHMFFMQDTNDYPRHCYANGYRDAIENLKRRVIEISEIEKADA